MLASDDLEAVPPTQGGDLEAVPPTQDEEVEAVPPTQEDEEAGGCLPALSGLCMSAQPPVAVAPLLASADSWDHASAHHDLPAYLPDNLSSAAGAPAQEEAPSAAAEQPAAAAEPEAPAGEAAAEPPAAEAEEEEAAAAAVHHPGMAAIPGQQLLGGVEQGRGVLGRAALPRMHHGSLCSRELWCSSPAAAHPPHAFLLWHAAAEEEVEGLAGERVEEEEVSRASLS